MRIPQPPSSASILHLTAKYPPQNDKKFAGVVAVVQKWSVGGGTKQLHL